MVSTQMTLPTPDHIRKFIINNIMFLNSSSSSHINNKYTNTNSINTNLKLNSKRLTISNRSTINSSTYNMLLFSLNSIQNTFKVIAISALSTKIPRYIKLYFFFK